MQTDEAAKNEEAERIVAMFVSAFSDSDIFHFERSFPNEAGQPMARAKLVITRKDVRPESIREELLNREPAIYSLVENGSLYMNPMMITEEEAAYILHVYQEIHDKLK